MAKKKRALGNDPFLRGAAARPPAAAEASPGAADGAAEAPARKRAPGPRTAARRSRPPASVAPAVEARGTEDVAAPTPAEPAAGLLPPDPTAVPREPRVVAVPIVPPAADAPAAHAPPPPARPGDAAAAALVALRQLLGLPAGAPSFDVDELGHDPGFEEQVRPLLDWFHDRWFRVALHGGDRLPQSGPVILVANRAGALPWDSTMLALACRRLGRQVRPLIEDDVFHLPALGVLVNRLGAVRACPENAELVLGRGGAIAVFPEGASGFGKPWRERYRLQRFGRGGFARIALRTGARIVPVAIVGSEEAWPLLGRLPGRGLGLPFVPITPTFPWLGLAGLLPLPSRWHIEIGEPIDLAGHGPEAAQDDPLVLRLTEHVRGTIQAMLDERLAQRRSIFA